MSLRAVVVDDEPLAVERMAALLATLADIELVGTASNGREAGAIVEAGGVDLLFLDVEMPQLDGFDLIDQLNRQAIPLPYIVLVTAHQIHAPMAFDAGVTDFLTKPVRLSRLETAVARVAQAKRDSLMLSRIGEASGAEVPPGASQASAQLWVQSRGKAVRLDLSRIQRLQAEREYVRLFIDGTYYLHREALSSLAERLDATRYIRIHRSSVIERGDVAALRRQSTGSYEAELRDGTVLPVGRTYRRAVRSLVDLPARARRAARSAVEDVRSKR